MPMTLSQSLHIRRREAQDDQAIARIVAAAFGGDEETTLVAALRSDGDMLLEMVAEAEREIVGHIAYSKLEVRSGEAALRAAALAPVCAVPPRQREGVGSELIRASLAALKRDGMELVVVLGHRGYYPRFAFSSAAAKQLDAPYSGESFMALELRPGCLADLRWKVTYAKAFAASGAR